jgi:hypothetical protein
MLNVFGSRQIRYMGTLGGNLASASPIGDMPPVLMAYEAIIKLVSFINCACDPNAPGQANGKGMLAPAALELPGGEI